MVKMGKMGKSGLWQLTFGSVHCANSIGSHDSLTAKHVNYTISMQQHILHKKLSKRNDGASSCNEEVQQKRKEEIIFPICIHVTCPIISLSLQCRVVYAAWMHDFWILSLCGRLRRVIENNGRKWSARDKVEENKNEMNKWMEIVDRENRYSSWSGSGQFRFDFIQIFFISSRSCIRVPHDIVIISINYIMRCRCALYNDLRRSTEMMFGEPIARYINTKHGLRQINIARGLRLTYSLIHDMHTKHKNRKQKNI